ncbi:epoxide hydrolase family protein [Polluticoccus soli]|uniref:epoxide hydrolase family protein n=1 Tax=Polluticoccus soli TaxID=3034150 RepID=UPI0023E28BEF|nr:epoxide hydrolase family protein [Flavipsychrobacter sp. JY13-12]
MEKNLVTPTTAGGNGHDKPLSGEEIRQFEVHIQQSDLDDLRRRIQATKFPEKELVNDPSQGVQLTTMKALAKYWATDYDWRKVEARLNSLPNFLTNIDGVNIHFIHVRSKEPNALPLILTHGWPGSIIEMLKVIEPLTDPVAHGGKAEDAFDVVIPSMVGYGFSGKPTETGWDGVRMAKAWHVLMTRLGYKKYVTQGGDWGALIAEQMGVQAPPELAGVHINMPSAVPGEILQAVVSRQPLPSGLSAEESHAYDQLFYFFNRGLGYAIEMACRPQTMYGIMDSPVGLAAWILDHDIESYKMIARVFDGKSEGLSKDDVLDNITLYWVTNTAVSTARLYWENKLAFFVPMNPNVPTAVSVFPDEIYAAPKNWVEKSYPNLVYYNKVDKGGHFAAWEQPKIFSEELRKAFKSVR